MSIFKNLWQLLNGASNNPIPAEPKRRAERSLDGAFNHFGSVNFILMRDLETGSWMSIQGAMRLLKAHGRQPNDVAGAVRTLVRTLRRNGITVNERFVSTPASQSFKVWWLPTESIQKIAEMKAKCER